MMTIGTGSAGTSPMARIEARLERIEKMLEKIDVVASEVPGIAALATDGFDQWAREDGQVDERVRELLKLVERLSRPEILRSMELILTQLEAAPGLFGMLGDMIDEMAMQAEAKGVDLHKLSSNLGATGRTLVSWLAQPETRELLDSGAFSPDALRTMSVAAQALAKAREGESERVGMFGALGALGDHDVQRALGFAVSMAKEFGSAVDREPTNRQLTAG